MNVLRLLFKHDAISLAPNTLNADSSAATVVLKLLCQSLVRIDHQGRLQPDLAVHWTVSPCRTRYRFTLDAQARFHSGRPCTAHDVKRVFEQIFNGRSNSVLHQDYEDLARIDVQDRHALEFVFHHPAEAFLYNLAWRTHIVDDTADQPCGTGPWRLERWDRGRGLVLARHRDARGVGAANFEAVHIRFAPDAQERLRVIEEGGADIVENVPGSAAQRLAQQGLLQTMAAPSQARVLLSFDCAQAPFDDVRVRQAIAHAVDRERLIRDVMGGQARLGDGILPEDDPWACALEPMACDPERARRLLAQAGHAAGLSLSVAHPSTAPLPAVAQAVARDLAAVGVHMQSTAYDDPPWWPYVYTHGPWQMAIQGTASRPHIDTLLRREFCSDGAFNAGRHGNREVDDLARQARRSSDDAQRRAWYGRIQHLLREELPVLTLFSSHVLVGWRPGVTGFQAHPHGVVDVRDVQLPPQPARKCS